MVLTDAQAEAGKAVAETTGKVVDAASSAGGYVARTVGDIPKDVLGLIGGDWFHEKRRRNLARMQAITEDYLLNIASSRLTEPSPSVVIPLLEAAVNEGREELQSFWAALLAFVDKG